MSSFYAAKIAALLHDPAWKPWIVGKIGEGVGRVLAWLGSSRPRGDGVRECEGLTVEPKLDLSAHELDAVAMIMKVVPDSIRDGAVGEFRDRDSVVRRADRLAASLDRWMLVYSGKSKSSQVKVPAGSVDYANPLEPRFRVRVKGDVDPSSVCRYVRSIEELFNAMGEAGLPLPLQYNVLYMLLEPLWYLHCRECVPPADTRTPTHTVFDHVYATAAMVNWVWEAVRAGRETPVSGFFVKIDVAGIQKFISASRKVRDLWAGSWLVSALAWATVSDAVKLLGADIVLSPYIGANHFYIASILDELRRQLQGKKSAKPGFCEGRGDSFLECIEDIARKAYLWTGAANQPIAPGTFFLALPCIDEDTKNRLEEEIDRLRTVDRKSLRGLVDALAKCDSEGVEGYFRRRFQAAWEKVANAVANAVVNQETRGVSIFRELAQKLEQANALAEGMNVDKAERYLEAASRTPPLHLRVTVVQVDDAYRDVIRKLEGVPEVGEVADWLGVDAKYIAEKLLFTYLFGVAMREREEQTLATSVSVRPGFAIASTLEDVTRDGFRECTTCSELPAVVHVSDPGSLSGKLNVPRSFFTSGELLCPYCLYRRLLTLNTVLVKVMENLRLYVNPRRAGSVYPRPPSTCELAAINALAELADRLVDMQRNKLRDFNNLVEEDIAKEVSGEVSGDSSRPLSGLKSVYTPLAAYVQVKCEGDEECAKKVLEILSILNDVFDVSCLLISVRSSAGSRRVDRCVEFYCGSDGSECSNNESVSFRRLCEGLFGEKGLLWDMDIDAGVYYTIVRGDGDNFGSRVVRGLVDYESAEDYVSEMLKAIRDVKARSVLSEELLWFAGKISRIAEKLGLKEAPSSLTTPSYYAALSRGQMITAIIDSMLTMVLAGFPVYAGGDDVAALAPGYIARDVLESLINYYKKARRRDDVVSGVIGALLERISLPPLTGFAGAEIAYVTRLNYWGMLQPREFHGFHRTPIGAVYPAPAAYGRSYGVLVAHYRDPFQAAWRSAGDLEELKDVIGFAGINCSRDSKSRKDAVFLAYGRVSGIAGTPFKVAPLPNRTPVDSKVDSSKVAYMLRSAIDLAREAAEDYGAVSRSIFYDFASECRLAERAAREAIERSDLSFCNVALELAAMLAARNASSPEIAGAARRLVLADGVQVVPVALKSGAEDLVVCRSFTPWLIVGAAKFILAGRR